MAQKMFLPMAFVCAQLATLFIVAFSTDNCKTLQGKANGALRSDIYTVNNSAGQSYRIYCQFYEGYGYTFLSSSTNVTVDMASLYDNTSHVIIRHKASKGQGNQYTSTIAQLGSYASVPVSVQYSAFSGYQGPRNTHMAPYIFVGYIPISMSVRGTMQGWKVNGEELNFTNCDGNPNSYIAFFFNPSGQMYRGHVGQRNDLLYKWYDSSSEVAQDKRIPHEFFVYYHEVHLGGCGGYSVGSNVPTWGAVGMKFNLNECVSAPCRNGATCNNLNNTYSCSCVAGWQGTNCEQDINECVSAPCRNGATCNNLNNTYSCSCVAGWQGTNCEQGKERWSPSFQVSGMAKELKSICRHDYQHGAILINITVLPMDCSEQYSSPIIHQVDWKFYRLKAENNFTISNSEVYHSMVTVNGSFAWEAGVNYLAIYEVRADINLTGEFRTDITTIRGYMVVACSWEGGEECSRAIKQETNFIPGVLNTDLNDRLCTQAEPWERTGWCYKQPDQEPLTSTNGQGTTEPMTSTNGQGTTEPLTSTSIQGTTVALMNGDMANESLLVSYGVVPVDWQCEVAPSQGYALITDFNITCNGLTVLGDLPLSYEYTVNTMDTRSSGVLLYSGLSSFVSNVKLQQGFKSNDYYVYLYVVAGIPGGTSSTFNTSFKVEPPSASLGSKSMTNIVKELIDISNSGQRAVVGDLISNGNVGDAVQMMDVIMSSVNSDEDTSGKSQERTMIRTAIVTYLASTIKDVGTVNDVFASASVLAKITQMPAELIPEMQVVAASVAESLAMSLFQRRNETSDPDKITDASQNILNSVGQLMDIKANPSLEISRTKNGTNQLLGVLEVLSNTLLYNQALDSNTTVLHTDTLSLGVTKVMGGDLASEAFTLGLSGQTAWVSLVQEIARDVDSVVGVQMMFIKTNPYTWDDSAQQVNLPVLSLELLNPDLTPVLIEDLTEPVTVNIPISESVTVENHTMILHMKKIGQYIIVDTSEVNVLNFNFTIKPYQTSVLTIDILTNLTNVLLYISSENKTRYKEVAALGALYPEQAELLQTFSEFQLTSNNSWKSLKSLYFNSNNTNELNYTSVFNVGISVKMNDNRTLAELSTLDPECLGNKSQLVCKARLEVPLRMQTHSLSCKFWNKTAEIWDQQGFEVSPYSSATQLQCLSTHMTAFSGGVFVVPNSVDPLADAVLFLTFFDNPVVVTTVIIVWMLYLFLIHWAMKADKHDQEIASVVWCGDESQHYMYLVCVVTGWWTSAGTTANVFFSITGRDHISPKRKLNTGVRPCFQTGYEDWFIFTTEQCLGDLKEICIWHDNSGTSPNWYLSQVFVKDLQSAESWTFLCKDWLAVDRGLILRTSATLTAVTHEELRNKRQHNFLVKSTQDLRDGHLWISIFSKQARSTFTRVQRLTCALSLLLTTMLTNIMFYGIPTDDPEDQVGGVGGVVISLSDIVIGIQSSLIMFPINLFILQLFLKLKPKPNEVQIQAMDSDYQKSKIAIQTIIEDSKMHGKKNLNRLMGIVKPYRKLIKQHRKNMDNKTKRKVPALSEQLNHGGFRSPLGINNELGDVNTLYSSGFQSVHSDPHSSLHQSESAYRSLHEFVLEDTGHENEKSTTGCEVDKLISFAIATSRMQEVSNLQETYSNHANNILSRGLVDVKESTSCADPVTDRLRSDSSSMKVHIISNTRARGKFLPWWFLYVAWVLVLAVSLICSYFVMLYGLKYGYQRSAEWLVAFLTGFTQSAFITQPVKVFSIAMVFTLIFKKTVEFDDYGPEVYVDEDDRFLRSVCKQKETYIPYSQPLSQKLMQLMKERLRLEWLMDVTLRDLLLYFVYLTVLLVVVYGNRDVLPAYRNTVALEDIFVNSGSLEEVNKVETFYQYLHDVAIPSLADMAISDHEYLTPFSNHFLLGPWRLRQLRVAKGSCYEGAEKIFERFQIYKSFNVPTSIQLRPKTPAITT
ncbi:polycystic kidney disease 1-related protein-like isoform X3 [Dreissena polymorpha]|uniref:polycystic kidney disease 1-related protein-like isoform X3 n=1 Tax=Dreissena polymorpha TaxID=45954 RepID=UPI002263BCC6|nr:polycystic kidney disease 1-related protein-like isoform X3 [Dreissena polymorpha]